MAHALFLSGKDDKDGDLMNKLALINIETMKLAKKKGKIGKFCRVFFNLSKLLGKVKTLLKSNNYKHINMPLLSPILFHLSRTPN